MLDIQFDSLTGESFYSDKMDEVVSILDSKGLLEESQNARVVNLEAENMPPCIIVKSDGASIYATRDLAAAIYRKRTYDFDKCIYVVGTPQALHFKQIFTVLKKAGFDWADNCSHVGFGLVKFSDKKLSTRSGDVIFLEDVLMESVKKTRSIIEENNSNLEDKEAVAETVGVGAIVYSFLKNGRERDMVFSWEDILDFEGESGPYVQYTYARGKSILRKAGGVPEKADLRLLGEPEEFQLVKLLEGFKDAVLDAAAKKEPSMVTRQVTAVARAFNKFYNNCPVLIAEGELKNARLQLTAATLDIIEAGLSLLGIKVVEKM
jgi:arginyl-tRNA synthetase